MANTTAAVRALITARLATNRLWARPVQNTPNKAIHSQSIGRTSINCGPAMGNRPNPTTRFWHNAACTDGTLVEPARSPRKNNENTQEQKRVGGGKDVSV